MRTTKWKELKTFSRTTYVYVYMHTHMHRSLCCQYAVGPLNEQLSTLVGNYMLLKTNSVIYAILTIQQNAPFFPSH